jgi:hypothetical protein
MQRVVIKLKDGSHINLPAMELDIQEDIIVAKRGNYLIAVASLDDIVVAYLSEKKSVQELSEDKSQLLKLINGEM